MARRYKDRVGLVLSGGGARGAYEVGLISGLVDVLGLKPKDRAPFQVFAGTSVGAINATFLAAHGDQGDMNVDGLVDAWKSLRIAEHIKLDPLSLFGIRRRLPWSSKKELGRSLLDPRPLFGVVQNTVPWDRLHRNIEKGPVHALVLTALHIETGETHMFTEISPGGSFRASKDPRRRPVKAKINDDHVLASAALPLIFPAHRVGGSYYCDGGIRFNTPLSPAIRAGADRLVVIPLIRGFTKSGSGGEELYPSPFFLLGKLLAALLLDPVDYDLQVLNRFNTLVNLLEKTLTDDELEHFHQVTEASRGVRYRTLETLSFRPTEDIGRMAGHFLSDRKRTPKGRFITELVIRRAAMMQQTMEADLVSFLLFDGQFAEKLINVGRRDAERKADEIRAFFSK